MADILFVTWDGGGNVPPALAIGRELQARGHTVRFLGHERQEEPLTSAGFEFVRPRHARRFSSLDANSVPRMMAVFADAGMGDDLLEEVARRPVDLVVVDCLMVGALHAAHDAGLRYAVLEHLYQGYYRRGILSGPMGLNFRLRGLRPRTALDAAAVRVLTTLPELDPVPSPPHNLRQVGPVVDGPSAEAARRVNDAEPAVLVSLSTYAYARMHRSLQAIVDATADLAARVVVTSGPAIDPASVRAPVGTVVHRFVPHLELMPSATLFVGHGGHGSTMQALAHDLPMVLMPMDRLVDQPLVARSIADAGAGRVVRKSASRDELAPVLAELLADGAHRSAAARLGAAVRSMPGAVNGADALEAAVRDGAAEPGRPSAQP